MNPQFLQMLMGMLQQQQQPRMQGFGGQQGGFGGYGQGLPPQLMQMLMQQRFMRPQGPSMPPSGMDPQVAVLPRYQDTNQYRTQEMQVPPGWQGPEVSNRRMLAPPEMQPGMRTDVSTNPTLAQPEMNPGGIVGQMANAAGMPSRFGPSPYGQAAAPMSNVGMMSPGNAMMRQRFPVRRMIGGGY